MLVKVLWIEWYQSVFTDRDSETNYNANCLPETGALLCSHSEWASARACNLVTSLRCSISLRRKIKGGRKHQELVDHFNFCALDQLWGSISWVLSTKSPWMLSSQVHNDTASTGRFTAREQICWRRVILASSQNLLAEFARTPHSNSLKWLTHSILGEPFAAEGLYPPQVA